MYDIVYFYEKCDDWVTMYIWVKKVEILFLISEDAKASNATPRRFLGRSKLTEASPATPRSL